MTQQPSATSWAPPQAFVDGIYNLILIAAVVFLIWLILYLSGAKLHHLKDALKSEWFDFLKRKDTPGANNMRGAVMAFMFSMIVIVEGLLEKVLFLASIVNSTLVRDIKKSADITTFFCLFLVYVICSLLVVVLNEKRNKPD